VRESREKTIGGTCYRVLQLGAKDGRSMLVQLTKLLGPALANGLSGLGESKATEVESAMASALGNALHDLALRLDDREVAAILDKLALSTELVLGADHVPRLDKVFDDHFAGKYDELLQWAAFALEVNFGSFFGGSSGASGLLGRLSQLMRSASTSPITSSLSGTSTGSPPAGGTARA